MAPGGCVLFFDGEGEISLRRTRGCDAFVLPASSDLAQAELKSDLLRSFFNSGGPCDTTLGSDEVVRAPKGAGLLTVEQVTSSQEL